VNGEFDMKFQGVVLMEKIPRVLYHFLDVEQYIYGSQE
jgi:hypothetical protein